MGYMEDKINVEISHCFMRYIEVSWYGFCVSFNPLSTKLCLSNLKTQFVPRRKHSASVIKTLT